ncbi:MAG: hypothetical protein HRT87_10070 [Legionellales bacterium]|nr:hypothetical protein [Legionellales bacterium]
MSINFNNTKNLSTYINITATYIDTHEQNFMIQEKRKINFGAINYFDNHKYGLMIMVNFDKSINNHQI